MANDKVSNKIKKRRALLGFSFTLIIIALLIFGALKSDIFIIKNVTVENNVFVTKSEITILSGLMGKNIFLIDKKKTEENIQLNPYIESIFIKRKLPSSVIIQVTEKKIKGIVKYKNGFINVDKYGKMVQTVNVFPNGRIPLILGLKVDKYQPNKPLITDDNDKQEALKAVLTTSNYNESKNFFFSIDIKDPYNIIFTTKDGKIVKIGDWQNIDYKIAYAISVLKSPSIKGLKGYVKIQTDGTAIFKKN